MEADLYAILGVSRDADKQTIRKAYKNLAFRWHPDKNIDNVEQAQQAFQQISDAYQILSDKQKRMEYDNQKSSNVVPRRRKSDDSPRYSEFDTLYQSFYGGKPVFSEENPKNLYEEDDNIVVGALIGEIHVNVFCSLQELYSGTQKTYRVLRCISGKPEKKTFIVTVTPGMPSNSSLRLKGEGNCRSNSNPDDIVFTIREKYHPNFIRSGDNIYEEIVVKPEFLQIGFTITRVGLDGKEIKLKITGPIKNNSEIHVIGRGFPNKEGQNGNCVFKVKSI